MNVGAWAFGFWQAWMYLVISLVSGATIVAYLKRFDPKLLERRLRGPGTEKETSQKLTQLAAATAFLGTIVICLLDHRFSWSHVPVVVTIAGCSLLAVGYLVIFLSLRENTFAAVNVAVESGQKVISTGPYAIVRHPYYIGLLVWVFATPLALGSWWGWLMLVPMVLVIASRIRYEEGFLNEHLCGYAAYCRKLRYRLVPLIW